MDAITIYAIVQTLVSIYLLWALYKLGSAISSTLEIIEYQDKRIIELERQVNE